MGYSFYQDKSINISFRSSYRRAVFGIFHVAFQDNDNRFYLSLEDMSSLSSALWFYQNRVLKRPTFPVYDGKGFYPKDVKSPIVLQQVLGLPEELFKRLNLNEDILKQIQFRSGLEGLKKESYISVTKPKKWFNDDFHLYCLKNGMFFFYEETKPFVESPVSLLPVFIREEILPPHLKTLYQEANTDRFVIDFLGENASALEVPLMRKLDSFSLDRRVNYFINDDYDLEISSLPISLGFKRMYALVLRKYIAGMIDVLYDDYSFEVLNKVTEKLSFMTVSKLQTERNIYTVSSYRADMYSVDGKKFYFSDKDKDLIQERAKRILEENPKLPVLCLYAKLRLPYCGFFYVKDLKDFTLDEFMARLPFSSKITETERFLSAKRFDVFYSYLFQMPQHRYAFLLRLLNQRGIEYESDNSVLDFTPETHVTIHIFDHPRSGIFSRLFDSHNTSLVEEILPSYLLSEHLYEDNELKEMVENIDQNSKGEAAYYFFHSFSASLLETVVSDLLEHFQVHVSNQKKITDFFLYLLLAPFKLAEREYRSYALKKRNVYSLLALDGLPKVNETYEPNLPYPYVTYGTLCYSFRKTYFSKAYICSSEKEAIEQTIDYLSREYKKIHPKKINKASMNLYVLEHLGLPDNVSSELDVAEDILPQIPFADHICHRCTGSEPSYFEKVDDNEGEPYNVYLTYIRANAAKHGLYFDEPIPHNFSELASSLSNGTYRGILKFDENKVDPILYPYIHINHKTVVALFSSFFSSEMSYDDFLEQVIDFANLGDDVLRKILFACDASLYPYIYQHMAMFTRLAYIYKLIEISYAFYVSRDIVEEGECEFCMNIDSNQRLPYPYVLLGETYNAYTDSPSSDKYFFCQCDQESMKEFISRFAQIYQQQRSDPEYEAAVVLGMAGLPFQVIAKLVDFDFTLGNVDNLMAKIPFRDSICRRCTGISHCAYVAPFRKAFPFKEDHEADYQFAINGMAHDGIKVMSEYSPFEIVYQPDYIYSLESNYDPLLPVFLTTSDIPLSLYSLLVPSKEKLNEWLYEFSQRTPGDAETVAYASGVILDTFNRNHEVFQDFFENLSFEVSLQDMVLKYFPEVKRVRENFLNATCERILGFLTYLIEKFVEKYALEESHIGR